MVLDKDSRHAMARDEILKAAWSLAHSAGLVAFTLKDLAQLLKIRAPSLYSYFDSKHAIYDAMFRQGNLELLARARRMPTDGPVERVLGRTATLFLDFCLEDPVRYQLLFQSPVPGFEPSPDAYAPAQELHALLSESFAGLGITKARHVDLWTALLSGLAAQQLANDPGGSRRTAIVDDAVTMYSDHVLKDAT